MDSTMTLNSTLPAGYIDRPPADQDLGPMLVKTTWSLLGVSAIVVSARLFVKIRTLRKLFIDDYLMILALALGLIHAVCITESYKTGLGRHLIYIPLDDLFHTLEWGFVSLIWGFLSPMVGRLSICTFLLWVSGTDPKIKRWPLYVCMVVQVVVNFVQVFLALAQCGTHLSALWDFTVGHDVFCWQPVIQSYYGYFSGSVNTVADLFLTIYPAVIVQHVAMTLKSKIGLWLLLCLSFNAMLASAVKTYESKALSAQSDYTYDLVAYAVWISVELNTVIIVASVPILRPLFRRNGLARISRPHPSLQEHGRPREEAYRALEGGPHDSVVSYNMEVFKSMVSTRPESTMSTREILIESRGEGMGALGGITRTVEVEVSRTSRDRSYVHAALVGLPMGLPID